MRDAADLLARLLHAATLRRAPLWVLGMLPWLLLRQQYGFFAWAVFCSVDRVRLHLRVRRGWQRWLDDAVPALEDSSAVLAAAETPLAQLQRQRLLARLDAALDRDTLRGIVRARIDRGWHWLAVGIAAAALVWLAGGGWHGLAAPAPQTDAGPAVVQARAALYLRVAPPAYTGVAPFDSAPRDLVVPESSVVQWCARGAPLDAPVELGDGAQHKAEGACARWTADQSILWRWHGARYNLRVTPDQAPQISVSAPAEMVHELPMSATSAGMAVRITDDYRVQRATLHMTLARGSGENIRFSDRELPIPAGAAPRTRVFNRQWALRELGMEPGDELYFFVRATDNAAQPHTVQSPTYTLRLPAPAEAADEQGAALPMLAKPESLRSQRQIIIDTEQLVADMRAAKVNAAEARERSETIAADQATLRRRYGQFLGEESTLFGGDDHDGHDEGAKPDLLHEFGHAHDQAENATLFDESTKKVLRRALSAMWEAEKALRAITPKPALPPEYKALEAIKELQQADRIYLHKTAFNPPAIKEEKRMTGDVVGAAGYQRPQGEAADPVPAELRTLIQALSTDGALPALWRRTAQDWVRERVKGDERRLAAQGAIQDVADGCASCRAVLRAWLRGAIGEVPVQLQARPEAQTAFTKAWRAGERQ